MKIQENEDYWFFNAGLPNEQFFDDGAGSVYISKKDGTLIPMHLWLPEVQELNSKFEENSKMSINHIYISRFNRLIFILFLPKSIKISLKSCQKLLKFPTLSDIISK